MKTLLSLLALLNGSYMLLDGLFVLLKGKYIGPAKPGPWATLFYKLHVDVFKLGPLFILFGLLWLTWLFGLWTNKTWTYGLGIGMCLLTLWYLPIGTFFSIIILITLLLARAKLNL